VHLFFENEKGNGKVKWGLSIGEEDLGVVRVIGIRQDRANVMIEEPVAVM
jgi:hypothetical protein